MARKPSKGAPNAPSAVVLYGNAQARAIAHVLESIPRLVDRHEVVFLDSQTVARKDLPDCAVLFDQHSDTPNGSTHKVVPKGKHVRFPLVTFGLLWPFNCPNPLNAPSPPAFPFGPFPNGDSFLLSCVKQNIAASDALRVYLNASWSTSWPDLDQLFRQESARLTAIDAANDIRIGSYILKHFRKQRLFVAPAMPTDLLLSELITRLLAAGFPGDAAISDADVHGIIASFGYRDYLGSFALPVHPLVAQHFQLEWFEPNGHYNYFDREQLTAQDYYERFLAYAVKRNAG